MIFICKNQRIIVAIVLIGFMLLIPVQTAMAYYLGDRILVRGSQGYDVQQLQKDLGYLGYSVGAIDGIFGGQTERAVVNFQAQNGLKVDGIVGPATASLVIRQVSSGATTTSSASRGIFSRFSPRDIYDLARVVHGEARGESFTGQVAVAAVVLNRLNCGDFGKSIQDVIYSRGAFTAVSDGQFYLEPNSSAYRAVEAALRGWDPTGGAVYYWNPVTATSKWVWSRTIINRIGKHVFAI